MDPVVSLSPGPASGIKDIGIIPICHRAHSYHQLDPYRNVRILSFQFNENGRRINDLPEIIPPIFFVGVLGKHSHVTIQSADCQEPNSQLKPCRISMENDIFTHRAAIAVEHL